MKKITFLLLMILPFIGIGQTFDFTNTDDGWTVLGGVTATNEATSIKLTTKDNTTDGSLKNPTFATLTAGVDTSVNTIVGVTLKNISATGPDFLRVSFLKPSGGRVYKNLDITTGDADFVTYWFDMSNANWTGTMDDIKLHFRAAGNTDYVLPDPQVTIDIDKIQIVATIPTTLQEIFSFATNNDTEGFIATNGAISGPTAGTLTFTPEALKFAKLVQNLRHVNATTNKTVTIVLKNNSSTNDQLRFVANGSTVTKVISTNDTEAKTYVFDLKDIAEWTGDVSFSVGVGISTGDNAGKAADAGTMEFSSIVIDNTEVLSTKDNVFNNLSIYPNPANSTIKINTTNTISKILVFDIAGKKVLERASNITNTLNVSKLNSGIYFVKVIDTKNNLSTQKLIIN
ncbi:T9SS type A sorting domain-containing protein [Polaribacter sp. SA4-12]|uniref:T9SS type A sorting domain-containing protein n=1 Tax=Polaribacter sp. SA4-12 TaxID=1312072 RepID=UPI0012F7446D|nr:T9SS type A sorting domain-containing protein [Polaribacter sp. SA4-12]